MKNLLKSIVISALMSGTAFAGSVCNYFPGGVTCGNGTVDNVTGIGFATLNGTTVSEMLQVAGSLKSQNAVLNQFNIIGASTFTNTMAQSAGTLSGSVTATDSKFVDLALVSNLVTLSATTTQNMTVAVSTSPAIMYLQNSTVVNGNITFTGGTGIVYVSGGSIITGQVINGTVVNQ